jgi:hypothetical protein
MKEISDFANSPLTWAQTSWWNFDFELRSRQEVLARLKFKGALSAEASGKFDQVEWKFKREGFWQNKMLAFEQPGGLQTAYFRLTDWTGGGWLTIAGGSEYKVQYHSLMNKLEFFTPQGQLAVRFKHGGWLHYKGPVEIQPSFWNEPALPLLIVMGWYVSLILNTSSGARTPIDVNNS